MPGKRATASSCRTASPSTQDWDEAMIRTRAGGEVGVGVVIMAPLDARAGGRLTLRGPSLLVVGLALQEGEGAVELLNQHQPRKPVGQGHPRQREREVCCLAD